MAKKSTQSTIKCSRPTAYRRIAAMVSEGKLKRSTISSGLYEKGEI